jgi:hypothetical protein
MIVTDPEFPEEVQVAMDLAEKMKSECVVQGLGGFGTGPGSWTDLERGSFEFCKGYIAGGAEGWAQTRIICNVYILYQE